MSWNPRFDGSALVALGVIAVLWASVSIWRSATLPRLWLRALVWSLRLAAIGAVLAILANPVRRELIPFGGGESVNVVLVDTSASMGLERPSSRFARALEWSRTVAENTPPGQTCRLLGFADEVQFTGEPTLGGSSTRLAQAIRRVVESDPDGHLASLVIVSDGRIHDREELPAALALARAHQIAISTHAVGRDEPQLNVFLRSCLVARSAPAHARVPIEVEIGSTGADHAGAANGEGALELVLKDAAGAVLTRTPIVLHHGSARRQLQLESGLRTAAYSLSLTHLDGELTTLDNDFTFTLEIADPKIRVFYAEGSQTVHEIGDDRWAAGRILPAAFARSGEIECDLFMLPRQGARGAPLYRVKGFDQNEQVILDQSRGMPRDREGWWKYDVVIISDIDRDTFPPEHMEWVRQMVSERGGGFCMIGGNLSFDVGHYEQTLWDKLIPVACQEFGFGHARRRTTPVFSKAARTHPILQLAHDPVLNDAILDCHPAFLGYHDIRRTKPGAVTLAQTPAGAPLIAVQDYGRGRTMAFLSDAAGGWGEGGYQGHWGPKMLAESLHGKLPDLVAPLQAGTAPANEFYNRFWINSMRWLAEKSVRRQHRALIGRSEAITYRPGEVVKVAATLLNVFEVAELAKQNVGARLAIAGSERVPLVFDRDRKEFIGQLTLPKTVPGTEIPLLFDNAGPAPATTDEIRLRVMQLERELENPAPDPQLLAEIAQAGGGVALGEPGEARAVFERHQRASKIETIPFTQPLWSEPWVLAALLGVLGLEWLIRRLAIRLSRG